MTYDIIFKPQKIVNSWWMTLLLAFFVSSLGIFLSFKIFPDSRSIVAVTFTIIPLVPILAKTIEIEERNFVNSKLSVSNMGEMIKPKNTAYFLKRHKLIKFYMILFLGLAVSFSFWYTFLPQNNANDVFKSQINTLNGVESTMAVAVKPKYLTECDYDFFSSRIDVTKIKKCEIVDYDKDYREEYLITMEGDSKPSLLFSIAESKLYPYHKWMYYHILSNNLMLLLFIFASSFVFGAGAIFTLAWNASILGVFIGDAVHRGVNILSTIPKYFTALSSSLLSIFFHGIFEISGFIFAALAGGILSVALVKRSFFDNRLRKVAKDSATLLLVSIVFIVVSALIEVLI